MKHRSLFALIPALLMTACASLPAGRGPDETQAAVAARLDAAPAPADRGARTIPAGELSLGAAIDQALQYHPRIRKAYAEIGYSRADLEEARRLPNPGFSIHRAGIEGGTEIARAVALSIEGLLTLPDRRALADLAHARAVADTAHAVLELAHEVESAWFEAVAASQQAELAQLIRRANRNAADLADRMVTAGTLPTHEAAEYRAAAAEAAIEATRSEAERLEARMALANLLVLPVDGDWTVPATLPEPQSADVPLASLLAQARSERLDLKALELAVAEGTRALSATKRWRWLGEAEFEYEHERATGEPDKQGPGLSLAVPLFDQGQAGLERARANLAVAQAEQDEALETLQNELTVARSALLNASEVVRLYRQVLLPNRERVVTGHQQEVDFMLKGPFELLAVRAEQYAAYQEYLEAIRDYWLARGELRMLVGGRLPDALSATKDTPGIGIELFQPRTGTPDPHAHH